MAQLDRRLTNVYVLADNVTAAFFSASGANMIDFEQTNLDLLFDFLHAEGCELLIISESYWDEVKKFADMERFPPIVIVPPFTGSKGISLVRLKEIAEQAVGMDILTPKKQEQG